MEKVSTYYNPQTFRHYQVILKEYDKVYKKFCQNYDSISVRVEMRYWRKCMYETRRSLEKQFWKNIGQNARARARIDKGN